MVNILNQLPLASVGRPTLKRGFEKSGSIEVVDGSAAGAASSLRRCPILPSQRSAAPIVARCNVNRQGSLLFSFQKTKGLSSNCNVDHPTYVNTILQKKIIRYPARYIPGI